MEQLIEFGMPNSNIGEIEIQGIELSTEVRMTESLRGFLSWTFLDAENRSSREDFLDRRPENSGNLGLEWNAVRSKFGLSATVRKQMMERDFSAWPLRVGLRQTTSWSLECMGLQKLPSI